MTVAAQVFLQKHNLPDSYLTTAKRWFDPLIDRLVDQYNPDLPPKVIGINGCQGSGKSTLGDYLCSLIPTRLNVPVVSLSLDDFYLTKAERNQLAAEIHPLLATRGVPGTHDIQLAIECVDSLIERKETVITRFNKQIDDRVPFRNLPIVSEPVGFIILEGWCLGAQPQAQYELKNTINGLEETEDNQGIWRNFVNQALNDNGPYQTLFNRVDELIMLKAPSFETVYKWRLQQEHKMIDQALKQGLDRPPKAMDDAQVLRFIQYFQRITEDLLQQLPKRANHLFELDNERRIISYSQPLIN
jgi:D-glycerate 3-kinase